MFLRLNFSLPLSLALLAPCLNAEAQAPVEPVPAASGQLSAVSELGQVQLVQVPRLEGVQFVTGSGSQILLEKDGKRYLIDARNQTIRELLPTVVASAQTTTPPAQTSATPASAAKPDEKETDTYYTEDIVLWNLPTAHHLEKKALIIDFTHRFAFDRAFNGPARVSNLLGMDGFSFSSFGLTYGITDHFFVGAYRTPTNFGRILEFYGGAQLSQESKGHPFSSTFRVGVEGTDHFRRKYITSLELTFARGIKKRAQIYFVPTISFNNRALPDVLDISSEVDTATTETTTAIGVGLSVDIRPTVALLSEVIQRTSGRLGTHRPSFMFGIQKKVHRHSFTLGVTNSPGTTLSTRSATRSGLGGLDDTFGGLTIGFNLSRRLF
ncbi:MAG: DUF5777 family beta-barrel protein [Acidobacteria bacterium]|nr:DUF5777 family beta-barrel protein [Acidobacteriota bacterium]MCI0720281.1 DUF5777 family beta-barrel protein [Acidobacteriota bacterium]